MPASASPWCAKRGTLPKLSTFLSQLKGGPFGEKTNFRKKISQCRKSKISKKLKGDHLEKKKLGKKSHNAEKLKEGTLWGFSTSVLSQNIKKLKGKNFFRKSLAVPKKMKGSRGKKTGKTFMVQSLGQIVQFGAIIFCRTFKNYFGQFAWIEKKRKATIIVAFHFMKRRLKMTELGDGGTYSRT